MKQQAGIQNGIRIGGKIGIRISVRLEIRPNVKTCVTTTISINMRTSSIPKKPLDPKQNNGVFGQIPNSFAVANSVKAS